MTMMTTILSLTLTILASAASAGTRNDFWRNFKARGVNLGNWLILEEWMQPGYYQQYAKQGGADEWTFCSTLGKSNCTSTLQNHWSTYYQEQDIMAAVETGVNLLRIPLGFWALIDPNSDEPYVRSTQMDNVDRVMGYAKDQGIYVVLDLHGLPGSQNGKDHSGHAGPINWYTAANQQRSISAVTALANWVSNSQNKDVVAAIEVNNEPNITTSAQRKTYETYLTSARTAIHNVNSSMPVMFHDAFMGLSSWTSFVSDPSNNYVVDQHKYYQGTTTNSEKALADACSYGPSITASKIAAPVIVGEFSVSVGGVYLDTTTWRRNFLETQWQQWLTPANSAGGAFWSFKVQNLDGSQNNGWSLSGLNKLGAFSKNSFDYTNALTCPASATNAQAGLAAATANAAGVTSGAGESGLGRRAMSGVLIGTVAAIVSGLVVTICL